MFIINAINFLVLLAVSSATFFDIFAESNGVITEKGHEIYEKVKNYFYSPHENIEVSLDLDSFLQANGNVLAKLRDVYFRSMEVSKQAAEVSEDISDITGVFYDSMANLQTESAKLSTQLQELLNDPEGNLHVFELTILSAEDIAKNIWDLLERFFQILVGAKEVAGDTHVLVQMRKKDTNIVNPAEEVPEDLPETNEPADDANDPIEIDPIDIPATDDDDDNLVIVISESASKEVEPLEPIKPEESIIIVPRPPSPDSVDSTTLEPSTSTEPSTTTTTTTTEEPTTTSTTTPKPHHSHSHSHHHHENLCNCDLCSCTKSCKPSKGEAIPFISCPAHHTCCIMKPTSGDYDWEALLETQYKHLYNNLA
ncbi:unnamed protein product [Phyllotreta striolata]|uniref:Uncharacterized protein n=1 Tax=Phyllotreta striolata TaxID=444603 RepID=A0A9N9TGL7_PHYSR|nr:unnamed protein product [Phyllotreta striolata]